jgi:hypothetical protein
MYIVTGNDDVFARNAKTGEILYKRWSWIDQKYRSYAVAGSAEGWQLGRRPENTFSISARLARPRNHCPGIAALVRADVSNGTEKPVRKLAG